ncbi:hypothetical protein C6495_08630 [Candidatus Poribacteria bacterium]|nr:MAG: hypothetical protein C6495_08630 [Candidatus Poribacteria bacterium]
MHEAPIVQYFGAHAAREACRKSILKVLELRLHPEATRDFQSTLEAIDDAQGLDELLSAAVLADTLEDFQNALDAVRK